MYVEDLAPDPAVSPLRPQSASSAGDPQGHGQSHKLSTPIPQLEPPPYNTSAPVQRKRVPRHKLSSWGHSTALARVEPRTEFSGWRPGEGCGLGAWGAKSSEPLPPELPGELAFLLPPTIYGARVTW